MKMKTTGFEKGEKMGVIGHQNFVADPDLEGNCCSQLQMMSM